MCLNSVYVCLRMEVIYDKKCLWVAAYPMLDVMVAADQACGCSDLLFRREVGIWKTTWRDRKTIILFA